MAALGIDAVLAKVIPAVTLLATLGAIAFLLDVHGHRIGRAGRLGFCAVRR